MFWVIRGAHILDASCFRQFGSVELLRCYKRFGDFRVAFALKFRFDLSFVCSTSSRFNIQSCDVATVGGRAYGSVDVGQCTIWITKVVDSFGGPMALVTV